MIKGSEQFKYESNLKKIRDYFFNCQWYEVYDFLEFMVGYTITLKTESYCEAPEYNHEINKEFINACNKILEEENSAYRFVDNIISPIISEEEISEIERAVKNNELDKFSPISIHLKQVLESLSNRENPDFRNSIKESISAVEALCNLIVGKKTTLGDCLKKLEQKIDLHPAFKDALNKLYGFTSDANGIRHSLNEIPNLYSEDARFMLVICSAFVNYLKSKISKNKSILDKNS